MQLDMNEDGNNLFRPYARLKVPADDLYKFLRTTIYTDEVDLPDGISDLTHNKVNNTVHINSVPSDDSIGDYTPTATIKGHIEESTIAVKETGEITHTAPGEYRLGNSELDRDDELNTTTIKYIKFYGRGDQIIVHELLRNEMFHILCELTKIGVKGYVQAVCTRDGKLFPVRYDNGYEQRDVQIGVQEYESQEEQKRDPDSGEIVNTWNKSDPLHQT